jgi:2',3'-cyclic-nucleotide 2'-phosphodiesterase (5'-nucleotidase family)
VKCFGSAMEELTILHTSDLHGRLSRAAVTRLNRLKQEYGALLLDSGDALPIPNVLFPLWRPGVSVPMERAGYDAVCMGNREYFFLSMGIRWAVKSLPCPLIATNVKAPDSARLQRMVLLGSPSAPVAVLGLARRMIPPDSLLSRVSDVAWLSPAECLPDALRTARENARWVVVLSHLGVQDDLELIAHGFGGDVLLGGHDHLLVPQAVLGRGSILVYSGYWARWVTIIRLFREGGHVSAQVEATRLT